MGRKDWNPDDYIFGFPDVPAYTGPLVGMPIHHKVNKVWTFVVKDLTSEVVRCLKAKAELAGLILSLAMVDYLAGYYCGRQSKRIDSLNYMREYFPNAYEPLLEKIYTQLRCGLVHNMAVLNPWKGPHVIFRIHSNFEKHLAKDSEGRLNFSVPMFLQHINESWFMFAHDIIMKGDQYPKLVEHFNTRFDRLEGRGAFMEHIPD